MATPTTTAKQPLELTDVQARHYSGHTPVYDPSDLRKAFWNLARGRSHKLMLDFQDPATGQTVSLTLRNIGTVDEPQWTVYGFREVPGNGLQAIEGIPTMTEVMQHEMSRQ